MHVCLGSPLAVRSAADGERDEAGRGGAAPGHDGRSELGRGRAGGCFRVVPFCNYSIISLLFIFYNLICNIIISLLFFRFDARAPQFLSSELAVLFSKTLFVIFNPEYF